MTDLEKMRLGPAGPQISRLGLGCWAIGGHGWGEVRDEDSMRAVKCALDRGVNFFDTADVYGFGKSETLLSAALGPSRNKVVIATKGGVRWNNSGKIWSDISPAHLRLAVENSLRRLRVDCIPLYYIHKPDDSTPIKESMAALARLREEGKIGAIGVANFSPDQILEASRIEPLAAVQVRLNLFDRRAATALVDICRERNISMVAWGALADGLLTGKYHANSKFGKDDHRSRMSEFAGGDFLEYIRCVGLLKRLSASKGRPVGQLALRWVLEYAEFTCALFGAKTDVQVRENVGTMEWRMTSEETAAIESVLSGCKVRV